MARLYFIGLVTVGLTLQCLASSPPPDFNGRPRGVAKSKIGFYDSSKPFTCLDGSRTMPYDHVNDDFCDCPDGSDEPGTPACSSLSGKFHCANKGHKPANIPASRVNDGICDCCDGSDEYDGRVQCADACKELGARAREEARRLLEVQLRGHQIRLEYSQQGAAKQEERKAEIAALEVQLNAHQSEADRLKALKEEAEAPETEAKDAHKKAWEEEKAAKAKVEAEEAFRQLDADSDGSLTVAEIQARKEFDKDQSGDVSEEEAKEWLGGEVTRAVDYFISDLWKSISDVYVLPVAAEEGATPPPPPAEGDAEPAPETPTEEPAVPPPAGDEVKPGETDAASAGFDESLLAMAEVEERANQQRTEVHDFPEGGNEPDRFDNDDDYRDDDDDDDDDYDDEAEMAEQRKYLAERDSSAEDDGMPEYDAATQELVRVADAARGAFNDAEKKREDVQRQIDDLNKKVNVDLGPNQEFQALQGNCYDFTDREYTYTMCAFDRISQKPKNGGSETSLGTWGKWDGGDGASKYTVMQYENGLNCWNGPNRSGMVKLRCGETNELVSAAEPNRCEYHFEFVTPAVCETPSAQHTNSHEEL